MRKAVVGGLVVAALVAGDVWAQVRGRAAQRVPAPDVLMLEGVGSSIGASVRDLRDEEVAGAKLPQPGGALVQDVREDGPAARAGLRSGDIVVAFDGERVRGARHFMRLVRETPPGRAVKGSVAREGARRDVEITPEGGNDRFTMAIPDVGPAIERGLRALPRAFDDFDFDFDVPVPPDPPLPPGSRRFVPRARLGVTLAPLSDQLATYFGVKDGVLVSSVDTGSAAGRAGIRAGDVITRVNGRDVMNVGDVTRAVRDAQAGATIDLRLYRDRKEVDVKVTLPEREEERPGVLPV